VYSLKTKLLSAVVVAILVGAYFLLPLSAAEQEPVVNGHPQPGIWALKRNLNCPTKGLVLEVTPGSAADATVAAALVPAFINRRCAEPLFFDDKTEARTIAIPHDSKKVSDFGADASSATGKIATTYWKKAEIVVVTDTFEHALWAVPISAFLQAPLLVSPSSATLTTLGTKFAVIVGGGSAGSTENIKLSTKETVWTFQLELMKTQGAICDYIVVTNPADLTATEWKGASLPSTIIAAYRNAVVLTTNRVMDKTDANTIAQGKAQEDAIYDNIKPIQEALKNDIRATAVKVKSLGHNPKFMALVGGPYELPNYYLDLHEHLTINGNSYGEDYVCSVTPYANLTTPSSWNGTEYLHEDLATGRIVGHSVLDTTNMLMRTLFYREFLTGGKYSSLAPAGWENRASVLSAHNGSQPEDLIYDGARPRNDQHYFPTKEWAVNMTSAGYSTTSLWIKNVTKDYTDKDAGVNEIWENFTKSGIILTHAHGDPDSTWWEAGRLCKWPGWKAVVSFNYSSGKFHLVIRNASVTPTVIIYNKDIPASDLPPSVAIMIACYTGEMSDGTKQTDVFSSAITHAGAVVFIAPTEYQTKCYWKYVPEGPGTLQTLLTANTIATQNVPVGTAYADAKWNAYQHWKSIGHVEDRDCDQYLFYGDPKLEVYKPNVAFTDKKLLSTVVTTGDINTGAEISVKVSVSDLVTETPVSGATVTVEFNGKTYTGSDIKVTGPAAEGACTLKVTASASGYEPASMEYTVNAVKATSGKESLDTTTVAIVVLLLVVVVVLLAVAMRKKPNKKEEEPEEEDDEEEEEEKEEDDEEEEKEKKKTGPKVLGD
jgi:ribosomal protein L12E/L44/L45/RPP1/RPP2